MLTKNQNELVKDIAVALHNAWKKHQEEKGVTLGPRGQLGKHPHICEFDDKEQIDKDQDLFQALSLVKARQYGLDDISEVPRIMHEAWRTWVILTGQASQKPHAKHYDEAHKDGPDEHEEQATLIWPILKSIPIESSRW